MSDSYKQVKPYLLTRSVQPENQETPIQFIKSSIVDARLFYRRNHFSYPTLSLANYWLPINGYVNTPTLFSMPELLHLPSISIKMILECSGNKRKFFEPKVYGEHWGTGAISQGIWKGVSLRTLLELCGIKESATQVLIEGYDYGERTDLDSFHTYTRSIPIEKALHPETVIAYEYNNQPIPFKHGYPYRLIVPQWYAMASVKWIKQISVINYDFKGPFQSMDYVYYPNKNNNHGSFLVTIINVNSTIQKPLNMDILNTGKHKIKGIAWTGNGFITKVEISTDNGLTWSTADIENSNDSYEWISWSYEWNIFDKGEYTIMSKATDSFNRTQPDKAYWNRKGYGYNEIDKIKVKIE